MDFFFLRVEYILIIIRIWLFDVDEWCWDDGFFLNNEKGNDWDKLLVRYYSLLIFFYYIKYIYCGKIKSKSICWYLVKLYCCFIYIL